MIPNNKTIRAAFFKAIGVLDSDKNIVVSVSGGSDSDIITDFIAKCGINAHYVFFNTGLEYRATLDHLTFLENRYNIHIDRIKAVKSIPSCCKTYGLPFLNKIVSEFIERLQRHHFKFEDLPYSDLVATYPGCSAALKWWCNLYDGAPNLNIGYNKYLKEFLIENPPTFNISSKCCKYAKKATATSANKKYSADIVITGLRKAERGARSLAYKSCYTDKKGKGPASYRPIWWFSDDDKREYNTAYNIINSDCYTSYKLCRTGCAGCPFARDLERELSIMRTFEPALFNACNHVFGASYDYTRAYRDYCKTKTMSDKLTRLKLSTLNDFLDVEI